MTVILPDVLRPGLRVVFCGSAAGTVSARAGAYYAGPGNRFWIVLHEIGLTPCQLEPQQFREVLRYGIGLTDMAKYASGADSTLSTRDDDPAGLHDKLLAFAPQVIAFNGKRAAQVFFKHVYGHGRVDYGLQREQINQVTAAFVLPSTSGAARRFWDVSYWKALMAYLRAV